MLNQFVRSASAILHLCVKPIFTTLRTWVTGFWRDMTGPVGYRGIAVIIAAYAGLYSIVEARHERQMNLAAYERNVLITMVSSANLGAFIAAMKNFGPVQTIRASEEPVLFEPWRWFATTQPNLEPLHIWAYHRLKLCISEECGVPQKYDSSIQYRVDLDRADLRDSVFFEVDLSNSTIAFADLRSAILVGTNLRRTFLRASTLKNADLRGAHLQNATCLSMKLSKAAETQRMSHRGFQSLCHIRVRTVQLPPTSL